MQPELVNELIELLDRWQALAEQARLRAEARPNPTYDGYTLGLEIAADDLTRVLGKVLKESQVREFDN